MRAILHFGTSKTGSTAIQDTFFKNPEILLKNEILYPNTSSYPNHTPMLFSVTDNDEFLGQFGRRDSNSVASSIEFSDAAWARFDQIIKDSQAKTLVISSEFIYGLRASSLKKLVDRINIYCDDIRMVGYFRSPASHYLSGMQQVLKYGSNIMPLQHTINFRAAWRKLNSAAEGACDVREFSSKRLVNGCVCTDFMANFLQMSPEAISQVTIERSNESVSAEGIALLQAFNAAVFPGERRVGNQFSRTVIELVDAAQAVASFTKPRLRPSVRSVIEHFRAADTAWLRDEMGLTFDDVDYDHVLTEPEAELAARCLEGVKLTLSDIIEIDPERLERLWRIVLLAAFRLIDATAPRPRRLRQPASAPGQHLLQDLTRPEAGIAPLPDDHARYLAEVIHLAEDGPESDLRPRLLFRLIQIHLQQRR
jgi:hypothetical protein